MTWSEIKTLYTWKDVDRKLKAYLKEHNFPYILDIGIYPYEVCFEIASEVHIDDICKTLSIVFGRSFDSVARCIKMDSATKDLEVKIIVNDDIEHSGHAIKEQKSLDSECQVVTFYSYRNSVVRDYVASAYVKEWSSCNPYKKLLIVDAAITEPGLDLFTACNDDAFSFIDFIQMLQDYQEFSDEQLLEIIDLIQQRPLNTDLGFGTVQHFVLPAYRYFEQIADPCISTANVKAKYSILNYLSKIGDLLGVEQVVVLLDTGVGGSVRTLMKDPLAKNIIIASVPDIKGTELLLQQLEIELDGKICSTRCVLINVPSRFDTSKIKEELKRLHSEVALELPFIEGATDAPSLILGNQQGLGNIKELVVK